MSRPKGAKETAKQKEAYQYWFVLCEKGHPNTEAIRLTAEHYNVTPNGVWNWHKKFNWNSRAERRRMKIVKEVEKQENKTLADNRVQYLKILHKLLDDYIRNGFPAQIESVKDLETVIKNCLLLQDAPTENIKQDTTQVNINAEDLFDEDLMRKIIEQETENNQENEVETDEDMPTLETKIE